MTITDSEAMRILVDRKLSVSRLDSGDYVCLFSNRDIRVRSNPMPTPTEAIEAAELFLTQRESNRVERVAKEVLQEQQRGEYFAHPRQVEEVDPDTGETVTVTVFDILKSSDNSLTPVRARKSVFKAWTDMIESLRPNPQPSTITSPDRGR